MKRRPEPEATGSAGIAGGIPAPASNPRFPLLDSLRAVAALAVVLTHTAFVSGAIFTSSFKGILAHLNIGVTLFFLISGFVLYRPFVAAREQGAAPPSVWRYARRRLLRIAPAYWLALTALAVFPGLYGVFSGNWWVYYGLLQPYPIFTAGADCLKVVQGCGIAQTWSLSIEVAFYAVLPLYALGAARLTARCSPRVGRRRDLALLGALGVASAVLRIWVLDEPRVTWMYGTVLGHFLWFAMGMGLAVASVAVLSRRDDVRVVGFVRDHAGVLWAAGGGGFLLLCLRLLPESASPYDLTTFEQVLEHVGFGLIVLALMLPAVFGHDAAGPVRRLLGTPALRWLGEISYGIFLWHLTVMFELADHGAADWLPGNPFVSLTLVTLAVTIPLAAASYYLLERPLMRMTWGRRPPAPARPSPDPAAVPQTATA